MAEFPPLKMGVTFTDCRKCERVEVVRSRWITRGIAAVCARCGASIVVEQYDGSLNFCMQCGADMRPEGGADRE